MELVEEPLEVEKETPSEQEEKEAPKEEKSAPEDKHNESVEKAILEDLEELDSLDDGGAE